MTLYGSFQAKGTEEDGGPACELCNAPGILLRHRGRKAVLCSKCVQTSLTWEASKEHLSDLLKESFETWLDMWANNPSYRDDWQGLYAQMTGNIDLERMAMEALADRRIFPIRRRS